jgi:hypothetical protein
MDRNKHKKTSWSCGAIFIFGEHTQGSRKLVPLVLPVPDKPHLVGQNEISMTNNWIYDGKSKEILSYTDKLDIWIVDINTFSNKYWTHCPMNIENGNFAPFAAVSTI